MNLRNTSHIFCCDSFQFLFELDLKFDYYYMGMAYSKSEQPESTISVNTNKKSASTNCINEESIEKVNMDTLSESNLKNTSEVENKELDTSEKIVPPSRKCYCGKLDVNSAAVKRSKDGSYIRCAQCGDLFHAACVGINSDNHAKNMFPPHNEGKWICFECYTDIKVQSALPKHICEICGKSENPVIKREVESEHQDELRQHTKKSKASKNNTQPSTEVDFQQHPYYIVCHGCGKHAHGICAGVNSLSLQFDLRRPSTEWLCPRCCGV